MGGNVAEYNVCTNNQLINNTPSAVLYNAVFDAIQSPTQSFEELWLEIFEKEFDQHPHGNMLLKYPKAHITKKFMDYIDCYSKIHQDDHYQRVLEVKILPFVNIIASSHIPAVQFGNQDACRELLIQLRTLQDIEKQYLPQIQYNEFLNDLNDFREFVSNSEFTSEVEKQNLISDIDKLIYKIKNLSFYNHIDICNDLGKIIISGTPRPIQSSDILASITKLLQWLGKFTPSYTLAKALDWGIEQAPTAIEALSNSPS